ncbi:hypothetical protein Clacol_006248 [Clathrus columnatus]|uniref:Fungal-type protein kinase domain-containing protein n=1 Tax=Clathrus columnatus TaxID=1419009 RepID=A0AAV5AJ74_9AGAM|nr:hypothetical protein Clacol_006248 [Clathrus columnatus]
MAELNPSDSHFSQPLASTPQPRSSNPVAFKQSESSTFTSTGQTRDSRMGQLWKEVINRIIGPMPVETFLREFEIVPILNGKSPPLNSYQQKISIVSNCKKKEEMYIPSVEAIRPLCPRFCVADTHNIPLQTFRDITIKPNFCPYNIKKPSKDEKRDITNVEIDDPLCDDKRGIDVSVTEPSRANKEKARAVLGDVRMLQLSVKSSFYIVPYDPTIALADQRGDSGPILCSMEKQFSSKTPGDSHIATVFNAGDILDQITRLQEFVEAKKRPGWGKDLPKKLREHLHYRLVLAEVEFPLTTFSSTKDLLRIMREALIDWDLSKPENDPAQAREAGRTHNKSPVFFQGTWQFTAARLLSSGTVEPLSLTDDIESFIYVLTCIAFKYTRHDMPSSLLTGFLRNTFDYAIGGEDGSLDNGGHKARYLQVPDELREANSNSKNLLHLLLEITETISTRYRKLPDSQNPLRQSWGNKN